MSDFAQTSGELAEPEVIVQAILAGAIDRSSMSDELHYAARGSAEKYHLDRGRANILRALKLPKTAKVLHIGPETGSLTRYLGEETGSVDAVEPSAELSRLTALRVADLSNVEVHPRKLSELPEEPIYDVIVAIGVLERLTQRTERIGFLQAINRRLSATGTICLAVENQFGVHNLAGSPDRHSHRRWDALEGYPLGNRIRAINRRELIRLLDDAGLSVQRFLHCFPDYRHTRAVIDPQLFTHYPRLAAELPRFPSFTHELAPLVDEHALWGELIAAGQGENASNSFFVLASNKPQPTNLWPENRLAMYFNTSDRASIWCAQSEVRTTTEGPEVRHEPIVKRPNGFDERSYEVSSQSWSDPVRDEPGLIGVALEKPWLADKLLRDWRELVKQQAEKLGPALWELVPHNVLVGIDGSLHAIDLEWRFWMADPETVIERGLLLTAERLAASGWIGAAEHSTVRDVAAWLGVLLDQNPSYIDRAVDREAHFQAQQQCGAVAVNSVFHAKERSMRAAWHQRLADPVLVSSSLVNQPVKP